MLDLFEEGRKVAAKISATCPRPIRKYLVASTPINEGISSPPLIPQNSQRPELANDRFDNPISNLDISPCNMHWINKLLNI